MRHWKYVQPKKFERLVDAIYWAKFVFSCRSARKIFVRGCPVILGISAKELETDPNFDIDFTRAVKTGLGDRGDWTADKVSKSVKFFSSKDSLDPEHDTYKKMLYDFLTMSGDHARCIYVVDNFDVFDASFKLAADGIFELLPATGRHIKGAFKEVLNVNLTDEDAEILAGIPISELNLAFRPGRSVDAATNALDAYFLETKSQEDEDIHEKTTEIQQLPLIEDLPGLGEADEWGRELAIDLADWKAGKISWDDVDRGILLSGPTGTGKTTFAGALARSCGVQIITTSVAKWQSRGHLGQMLASMRSAFDSAKRKAPCILFIDEIDYVGSRSEVESWNSEYNNKVINGLLEHLDGLEGREGVVVVGATNKPGVIDEAIGRPGRLDRHVEIGLPDKSDREKILRWHLKGSLDGVKIVDIAERTEGMAGAGLEQIVRGARRLARRQRRDMIIDDLISQLPKLTPISQDFQWRIAVHEAGHAVIGRRLQNWRISGIWISTHHRDDTGYGRTSIDEELTPRTTKYLFDHAVCMLAAMSAEREFLGDHSEGGASDLYMATHDIYLIEAKIGGGPTPAFLCDLKGDWQSDVRFDHALRHRIEQRLDEARETADRLVKEHRDEIYMLAKVLLDVKKMSAQDVEQFFRESQTVRLSLVQMSTTIQ